MGTQLLLGSSYFHFNYIEEGWAECMHDALLAETPNMIPCNFTNVPVFNIKV